MRIIKVFLKHSIIMGVIIAFFMVGLYIASHFTPLHPDAYVDGALSVVLVYAGVIGVLFFMFVVKRYIVLPMDDPRHEGFRKMLSLAMMRMQSLTWFEMVALIFLFLTFVNSVMMIVGMDTPKVGTFAYVHLLIRMFLISGVVTLVMWESVWLYIRRFIGYKDHGCHTLINEGRANVFIDVAKRFTLLTVGGSLMIIGFSRWFSIQGGRPLYSALVLLALALVIGEVIIKQMKTPQT